MCRQNSAILRRRAVIAGLALAAALVVMPGVYACSASRDEVGSASRVEGASRNVLVVRDGRYLCDLATLSGSCRNTVDLGGDIESITVSQCAPRRVAFETIVSGSRRLQLFDLDSGARRDVAEEVIRAVGFDGEGSLYYLSRSSSALGELVRYDTAVATGSVVAATVVDALADPQSSALACVVAESDVAADPIDSRAIFLSAADAVAVEVGRFEDGQFCNLVAVTSRTVLYVDNKAAGETHGHLQAFDVETGDTRSIALGARVVAVSRDRDAVLLAKYSFSGDAESEDGDMPASTAEQLYVARLDGARPLGLEPVGRPISGAEVQSVFLEDRDVVAVAFNRPDGNDEVVTYDLTAGRMKSLLTTEHEAVENLCFAPDEGSVVCVLSRLDAGGTAWSDSVVVLSPVESESETPVRIHASPPGDLDLIGWTPWTSGSPAG